MAKQEKEPIKEPEKEPAKENQKAEQGEQADTAASKAGTETEQADSPTAEQELQKKLDEVNEELKKQKDLLLRTAAEYDNYRKRTEREKAGIYADATATAVQEFLPVADNLARALEQKECSVEDLRKGVEMVNIQMEKALEKLGITAMGEVGEEFNPDFHNAVSHIDDDSLGENTISMVMQKGYKLGDKVVRHAMVQVAN